ncbi:hypothetical protein DOE78_07385 [Bacillus sp. Y1]|uniref:UPF0223 family protein n=1 Tax=Robertmurraya sp. TaxID=2837525 RepID=UPI000E6B2BDE|nr:UPF0223 family protein [Bacillus sp. Y1]AYA75264.1 hypothetical protein DOE78_07385 [Bacillus sp. Y1]
MEYQYPIDHTWSTDEIIDVIKFFEFVEAAYEKGVGRDEFMKSYRRFKEIVPSKSEEKKICDEFAESSGYSTYLTVKKAKEGNLEKIKMK